MIKTIVMKFISTADLKFRNYDSKNDVINHFTLATYTNKNVSNITRFIGEVDINDTDIYEGDILMWESGSYTGAHLSSADLLKANQAIQNWINAGRIGDFDYELNGWKKVWNVGVVVFYKGTICLHTDFDTEDHANNSPYNGTTYFGNFQKSKNYVIIGNVYRNNDLLKNIKITR